MNNNLKKKELNETKWEKIPNIQTKTQRYIS